MRRGRKTTPTVLKLARGNPGKRALNLQEPTPATGVGSPPPSLKGAALAEWTKLGPELERMGVMTHVDAPAFIVYCQSWARYLAAEEKVAATGEVVSAPSGYPIPNPWRAVANKAYLQCREFWAEFGMTPSSRTRIQVKPKARRGDAAEARRARFFGTGGARG